MSPESWKKVKEAFTVAIELGGNERRKFVYALGDVGIREKVSQMIAADEINEHVFNKVVINLSNLWSIEKQEDLIGAKFGKYRLLREIGRGGMGVVFEVIHEAEDVSQHVALKILRRGMDSEILLRSFHNERKILASLKHQHIVRLLDAGVAADGLPFYTMELVEGKPLDEYVEEKNPSLEFRLKLFQQICSAVTYAHGKLVVHRDLKPSNVLVTPDGNVKLLDFGIAKTISLETKYAEGTATKLGILTPRYASPEQIRGETVSVASDVYNLGIILYELLTGVSPYNFDSENPIEIARIIAETEPKKPSEAGSVDPKSGKKSPSKTRNPQLKGDLDTIILKSLQKIPSRRYASVEQFSNDISRYLKGLPIKARPDTLRYRTEKFIKRNRLAVGAAGFMILTLVIGASVATWQAIIAQKQRAFVLRRFDGIRELANKAAFWYFDEFAKLPRSTKIREELVKDTIGYMDSLANEDLSDPLLKLECAKGYRKVADVQGSPETHSLGRRNDALTTYKKSVVLLESALKIEPNNVELKKELILSLMSESQVIGDNSLKEEILKRIQELHEEIGGQDSDPSETANRQAKIFILTGDIMPPSSEQLAVYQKAYDLLNGQPEKSFDSQLTFALSVKRLGSSNISLGNQAITAGNKDTAMNFYKTALPYFQQYVDLVKSYNGDPDSPTAKRRIAIGYQNLGEAFIKINESKSGFENLNNGLVKYQEYVNNNLDNVDSQIDISNCYFAFANAYDAIKDLHRAIEFNQKSLEILNKVVNLDGTNEIPQRKITNMYKLIELYGRANQPKQSQNIQKQLTEICSVESNKQFCKN